MTQQGKPVAEQDIDLRRLTVAAMMTGVASGEAWAWKLLRQLVQSAVGVSAQRWRRGVTPVPGPRRVPR